MKTRVYHDRIVEGSRILFTKAHKYGYGGIFFNKPGNQFRKKNAKKRLHTRKYFHPRFFCTSVNCTSSFKRNLKTGFEIKIRGKFLFKIHSAKTKKLCLFCVFCKLFFKHSILLFSSFLRKIRNPQVGASHFPKRWAGNL